MEIHDQRQVVRRLARQGVVDDPGVADFYLFVMLLWAERFGVETPAPLEAMRDRMRARPAVRAAMVYEGLLPEGASAR